MGKQISEIDSVLAQRICKAREEKHLKPQKAAIVCGFALEEYLAIEGGEVRISALMIARVAATLDKPIVWFFQDLPGQEIFD